uniref:Uncharacterized protein n=1 Tax=Peronospora matthiolae TaxID=2874970 RepID=A0AAV1TD35_9STRA
MADMESLYLTRVGSFRIKVLVPWSRDDFDADEDLPRTATIKENRVV